jgi:hypothetical protein
VSIRTALALRIRRIVQHRRRLLARLAVDAHVDRRLVKLDSIKELLYN